MQQDLQRNVSGPGNGTGPGKRREVHHVGEGKNCGNPSDREISQEQGIRRKNRRGGRTGQGSRKQGVGEKGKIECGKFLSRLFDRNFF